MAHTDAWLALHTEETLEPDLKICDPHHHLWHMHPGRFVEPDYLLPEIVRDVTSGHNIVSTVFIECGSMYRADGPEHMKCIGETEFVNGIAAMSATGKYGDCRISTGIIGTAPLQEGDTIAGEVLDAQLLAGNGRFRGIRCGATYDASPDVPNARTNPPPNLYGDAGFRAGFKHLAPRNLTFEGWECPNVTAKLGGLFMEVNGHHWEDLPKPPTSQELMERTRRYFETTIGLFGVDRCMFESNFPVDMIAGTYNTCWNAFKRLTADYSDAEKAALYHDTATRVYRI